MNRLSCAIVEDDDICRSVIEGLCDRTGFLHVLGTFSCPQKAVTWLTNNTVDLLFVDVEMHGMNGIDMLRALRYQSDVIVVSGKPGYAIEAFDLAVTDYLLKPLNDYERFLSAVRKAAGKRTQGSVRQSSDNLFIKVDSMLMKMELSQVYFFEAFGDYVKIQTGGKVHTVYSTLKKVEEKLDPSLFVRVHRSFIVNLSKVTNIDGANLEINKTIIPVSVSYKNDLLNRINIL